MQSKFRHSKYIAVSGNIGAGKSTLVKRLEASFKPFYEPNESNPYLKDFYGDMKKYGFQSQVYFLTQKFKIHQELEKLKDQNQSIILDRTIYEDAEIFGVNLYESGLLSQRDFQTYWSLYEALKTSVREPDIMIYLTCEISELDKRIKNRAEQESRKAEKNIPISYLEKLQNLYDSWIKRYEKNHKSQVIVLDSQSENYLEKLIGQISN